MAESHESQHSLIPQEDLVNTHPARSSHPPARSSSSNTPQFLHSPFFSNPSFSDEVFRDVGLGITEPSQETLTLPANKPRQASISSITTNSDDQADDDKPTDEVESCTNRSPILQRRLSWVPITILILASYATVFSAIYLIVAFRKPSWNIINEQKLDPSTATLLCAFFAKTIELAYVTVCVAFLGQVLSRRALIKDSQGVSIADMNMRAWITQPGSMIVHWETLRYSGPTVLGAIALVATLVSMLYTTAAEALGKLIYQ